MKRLLLGAAAALAIAAPGVASAQSGFVDLGYSSTDVDSNESMLGRSEAHMPGVVTAP